LTDSKNEADGITETLEKYNKERQRVESEVYEQAEQLVHSQINLDGESIIVLANPNWHIGVLGIVCSKLVEEFERPVILIGLNGEQGKGSGRSVDGFNIVAALEFCSDTLLNFGGHEMACGVTIEPNQVINFREKINQFADQTRNSRPETGDSLSIDTEIQLSDLTESFLDSLHLLAPHGPGNLKPLFLIRNVTTEGPPRIIKDTHLKLRIRDGNCRAEGMWFGNADKADLFKDNGKSWDLACHARLNDYNGFQSIELQIKDVRPAQR
jgi:single-stranded-DNA-specific exonuclease